MTSMPWVKLYTEMLDDPKMAEINPIHKWFFVQLILLAGECDQEGLIPLTLKQIAWRLREAIGDLEAMLYTLQEAGLVTYSKDDVFVVSFSKRQDRPQSVKQAQWVDAQRRHRAKPENVIHDTSMTNTDVILVDKSRVDKIRVEESRGEENNTASATSLPTDADIVWYWTMATSMPAIPSGNYERIMEQLYALHTVHRGELANYLKPFYAEWCARNYSKSNTAWMDWAISGHIPERKTQPANGRNKGVEETLARLEARRKDVEDR